MIGKGRLAVTAGAWLAMAAIPLSVLGCQDQGRADTMPNSTPNDKMTQPSTTKLDDATKTTILLRQLHAANQEEIDLGKIADDKAQNAEVKRFANEMVTDHTAADQKLVDVATQMNIELNASTIDPAQK